MYGVLLSSTSSVAVFLVYSCITVTLKQQLVTSHWCRCRCRGAGLHARHGQALPHWPHLTVRPHRWLDDAWVPRWAPLPWAAPEDHWRFRAVQPEPMREVTPHPSLHPCLRSRWPGPACTQEGLPRGGATGVHSRSCLPVTRGSSSCMSETSAKKLTSIFIFLSKQITNIFIFLRKHINVHV